MDGFLRSVDPDVICLQEIRATPAQIGEGFLSEYYSHIHPGLRKGHSGVATYTKLQSEEVSSWDGRFLQVSLDGILLSNSYVPAGFPSKRKGKVEALREKLDYLDRLRQEIQGRERHVLAGDFNIAHTDLDLHYNSRSGIPGCTREEAEAISSLGMVDSFRELNPGVKRFTWWSSRTKGEDKGWRIDYIFTSQDLRPMIKRADILPNEVSDHAATILEIRK